MPIITTHYGKHTHRWAGEPVTTTDCGLRLPKMTQLNLGGIVTCRRCKKHEHLSQKLAVKLLEKGN